jgi:hypothetical protein
MRMIGAALVVAGVAGFFLFAGASWRWESLGVAVTGVVLLFIPARGR